MTVCNMSIEAGARAGMVAPDDTTFSYLDGRPFAPSGKEWEHALDEWRSLATDPDAAFDKEVVIDAATLTPHVSWGTNPGQVVPIDGAVPDPGSFLDPAVYTNVGLDREVAVAQASANPHHQQTRVWSAETMPLPSWGWTTMPRRSSP